MNKQTIIIAILTAIWFWSTGMMLQVFHGHMTERLTVIETKIDAILEDGR